LPKPRDKYRKFTVLDVNGDEILLVLSSTYTLQNRSKQGDDQQIFIGNRFHVKLRILSPDSDIFYEWLSSVGCGANSSGSRSSQSDRFYLKGLRMCNFYVKSISYYKFA